MFWNMDLPEPDNNEFDKDITSPEHGDGPDPQVLAFIEMRDAYEALLEAGFTEVESLRFLAFCTLHAGDE